MNAPRLLVALIAFAPALAAAHPGHDDGGTLAAGLMHPLIGMDHLAAALLAGIWGAQRGARWRLVLPAGFLVAVIAGLLLAPIVPIASSATEQAIAASLLVMGAGLALAWRVPSLACVAIASAFGFFHGLAHGAERPDGALLAYGAGLVVTTAVLLAAGVVAGVRSRRSGSASSTACRPGGRSARFRGIAP